jgi:hypothetical protein
LLDLAGKLLPARMLDSRPQPIAQTRHGVAARIDARAGNDLDILIEQRKKRPCVRGFPGQITQRAVAGWRHANEDEFVFHFERFLASEGACAGATLCVLGERICVNRNQQQQR